MFFYNAQQYQTNVEKQFELAGLDVSNTTWSSSMPVDVVSPRPRFCICVGAGFASTGFRFGSAEQGDLIVHLRFLLRKQGAFLICRMCEGLSSMCV